MQQIVLRRHGPKLRKKLQEKFKWYDRVFELIDWEMHRVAVSRTPKMEYINIFKNIFKWQAVNKTQATYYKNTDPDPNCPLCKDSVETQDNVYQCHHTLARQAKKKHPKQAQKLV